MEDVLLREGRALEELYVQHAPRAQRLAYLLTGDRDDAADLVQEAFVRVAGRFGHLRNRDALPAYLRSAVVNLHTSRLRRLRTERRFLERAERSDAAPQRDLDLATDMEAILRLLPPRQRAAMVLRYYEDLTEAQAAEVMRCSAAAVKSLVARATRSIRSLIGEGGRE